jgi:hypothetical protein
MGCSYSIHSKRLNNKIKLCQQYQATVGRDIIYICSISRCSFAMMSFLRYLSRPVKWPCGALSALSQHRVHKKRSHVHLTELPTLPSDNLERSSEILVSAKPFKIASQVQVPVKWRRRVEQGSIVSCDDFIHVASRAHHIVCHYTDLEMRCWSAS